jgi:xanthine dehydrogenase accessory factor
MAKTREFTSLLHELADKREPFVVATVVSIEGSSLGKPGFKAVVSRDGKIVYGSVGGVCPESAIATMAIDALRTGKARVVKVHLQDARAALDGTLKNTDPNEVYVETNCGGMMEIYVDPYQPADRLILIGQGGKDDVEESLVKFGKALGFETVVIDHLPVFTEDPDVLITDLDYDLNMYAFSESDSVVVMTKGERDIGTLEMLSKKALRYVGMLASRQRTKEDFETLRANGVPSTFIESIHAPVGLDIGAVTPEEIALSIMTEIIGTKRGKMMPRKSIVNGPLTNPTS